MKESPLNKALVGDQDQLPEQLKEKILSAPEDSPVKMYDSPVAYMTPMASESGFKMKMGGYYKLNYGVTQKKCVETLKPACMESTFLTTLALINRWW